MQHRKLSLQNPLEMYALIVLSYCDSQATGNPAWPLSVLLAIQLASLLMTMVRKGLLSARSYHYGYTASLIIPYFVGFRDVLFTRSPAFPATLLLGAALYQGRRRGMSKYALWLPVLIGRFAFGDRLFHFEAF